jgi:hypothetical protein
MPDRVKKSHPTPKRGDARFNKLHRVLTAEFAPDGALEDDIVATIARLVWCKRKMRKILGRV